jgi:hypothetical protein
LTRALACVVCLAAGAAGCSLAYPLDEYDEAAEATSTAVTSSTGASQGAGGAGAGGMGGQGGALDCGEFVNPPVSSFTETFDAGFGGVAPVGACIAADAGTVLVTPPESLDYCWMALPGVYRLTCDALTFRVLEATNPLFGAQTYVYLDDLTTNAGAHLILENGGFLLSTTDGSASVSMANNSYNPNTDHYWRLRADQTLLYFETSIDGSDWVVRGSGPHLIPVDNLRLRIGAGTHAGLMGTPGQARFDCLNVTPCP